MFALSASDRFLQEQMKAMNETVALQDTVEEHSDDVEEARVRFGDLQVRFQCKYCKDPVPNIVEDLKGGMLCCGRCGYVYVTRLLDSGAEWRNFADEGQDKSRVAKLGTGGPSNHLSGPNHLDATSIGTLCSDKGLVKAQRTLETHVSDKDALRDIDTICGRMGLPQYVADHAKRVYAQATDMKIRGKTVEAKIGACLYLACGAAKLKRPFEALAPVVGADIKSIARKTAPQTNVNVRTHLQDGTELRNQIEAVVNQLALPYKIAKAASDLAIEVKKSEILTGRHIKTIIAAYWDTAVWVPTKAMIWPVILAIVFVALVTVCILWYLGDNVSAARDAEGIRGPVQSEGKVRWYAQLTAFLGWFFPFCVPLLLPIDLASALYRLRCADEIGNSTNVAVSAMPQALDFRTFNSSDPIIPDPAWCQERMPIAFVSSEFMYIFWELNYWTSFFLTWVVIPIMQGYRRSGKFSALDKLKEAVWSNIVYLLAVGVVGAGFIIYIAVANGLDFKTLTSLLIAASNAYGLTHIALFLGHGLVSFPSSLFRSASHRYSLRTLEGKAPKNKEKAVDAESDYLEVVRDIAGVWQRLGGGGSRSQGRKVVRSRGRAQEQPETSEEDTERLRKRAERLVEKCPLALSPHHVGAHDDSDSTVPSVITEAYLESLHVRLKTAIVNKDRSDAQWERLLRQAWFLQDIVETEDGGERKLFSPLYPPPPSLHPGTRDAILRLRWYWFVIVYPSVKRFFGVVFALFSVCIVWSEVTFQFGAKVGRTLTLFGLFVENDDLGYGVLEMVSFVTMLYLCVCAYSSLMKMRVFSMYVLVPDHHTDEGSMLFFAAYFCRLNFPLCYNFLNLLTTADSANTPATATTFVRVIGKIDLVPLLGGEFNLYFPLVIVVICAVVFFNVHGRLLRMCGGFGDMFFDDDEPAEDIIMEGRQLIEQARAMEERRLGRGNGGGTRDAGAGTRNGRYGGVSATDRRRRITSDNETTGTSADVRPNQEDIETSVPSLTSRLVKPFLKNGNKDPITQTNFLPPSRMSQPSTSRSSVPSRQSQARQSGDSDVGDSERRELLGPARPDSRTSQKLGGGPSGLGIGQMFGGRSRGITGEGGGMSGPERESDFAGGGYSMDSGQSEGGFSSAIKGFLGKWNGTAPKSGGYTSLGGGAGGGGSAQAAVSPAARQLSPSPRKTTPTFARAGGAPKKTIPTGLFDDI
ncbi:LMBR1-domain-containing protein, partial [Gonapodya prolifera JEL478]